MNDNTFIDFLINPQQIIYDYQRQAGALSLNLGIEQREDGPSDAFRHCFTSAAVARDFGAGFADLVGTLHEVKAVLKGISTVEELDERTRMDYWNNAVGRFIAKEVVTSGQSGSTPDTHLAKQCKTALEINVLIREKNEERRGVVLESELQRLRDVEVKGNAAEDSKENEINNSPLIERGYLYERL